MTQSLPRIAQFFKVAQTQFEQDFKTYVERPYVEADYQDIPLPKRATKGSAGYDFFAPYDIVIPPKASVLIPTGICAKIATGYVLMLYPRSSLGFKYRMQLDNTVGVIDSDYFYAKNGGHILVRLTNDSHQGKEMTIAKGTAMVQGIFMSYGITVDDDVQTLRTGGLGSTTKKG